MDNETGVQKGSEPFVVIAPDIPLVTCMLIKKILCKSYALPYHKHPHHNGCDPNGSNTPFTLQRLDCSHRSGTFANHSVNGTVPNRTVLEQNGKSCHSRTVLPDNVNTYRSDTCALVITLNNAHHNYYY